MQIREDEGGHGAFTSMGRRRDGRCGRDVRYTDASGERDLGNGDRIVVEIDHVVAEGDWGRVRAFGGWIRFEVS